MCSLKSEYCDTVIIISYNGEENALYEDKKAA